MGKGWREAERVRPSGKIRLTANLWIRGDGGAVASEKWRGAEGMAGIGGRDGEGRNGYGEAGRFAWRRISGYAATAEPSPAKIGGERRDCEETE